MTIHKGIGARMHIMVDGEWQEVKPTFGIRGNEPEYLFVDDFEAQLQEAKRHIEQRMGIQRRMLECTLDHVFIHGTGILGAGSIGSAYAGPTPIGIGQMQRDINEAVSALCKNEVIRSYQSATTRYGKSMLCSIVTDYAAKTVEAQEQGRRQHLIRGLRGPVTANGDYAHLVKKPGTASMLFKAMLARAGV